MEPVEEKAQHDPHEPWFLTPVTALLSLQSTEPMDYKVDTSSLVLTEAVLSLLLYPSNCLYSYSVKSAN